MIEPKIHINAGKHSMERKTKLDNYHALTMFMEQKKNSY
jgi:hypothetical protein